MARPVRLVGISYTGFASYFVTTCTSGRSKAFEDLTFGRLAADALLAKAATHGFAVSAYCLMPDHAHVLLTGLSEGARLQSVMASWKQSTGFSWGRRTGRLSLWQEGYFERVVRDDEAMLSVARYIVENPQRAKLVTHIADYPLLGSSVYTLEQMLEAVQMDCGSWR